MNLENYFSVAEAAQLARVSKKRIFQLLKETELHGETIDSQCVRWPEGAQRPTVFIPRTFQPFFASYQPMVARQNAGQASGKAREKPAKKKRKK